MKNYNSKLKIIIFVLAIVGLFIYGYSKATPGVKNQATPKPQIEITPQSFDFGEVSSGQVVAHRFSVKNIGNASLEISRVSTSCGCTSAEVDKEKLAPGEEVELLVTYDSGLMKHEKGKIERFVYIRSNDPLSPQTEVTIYAWVK